MTLTLEFAPDAEADIDDILEWSVNKFGAAVRDGYEELISTAIDALLTDPEHPATHERPELGPGIRIVHLRSSRDRVPTGTRKIRASRHFVVYRRDGDVLQVVRILHDAMDAPRHHLP